MLNTRQKWKCTSGEGTEDMSKKRDFTSPTQKKRNKRNRTCQQP